MDQSCVDIHCDSQSALHLTKNLMYDKWTKHIDMRLHFNRDDIAKGSIRIAKIESTKNPVDMLTKSLPIVKFDFYLNLTIITAAQLLLEIGERVSLVISSLCMNQGEDLSENDSYNS